MAERLLRDAIARDEALRARGAEIRSAGLRAWQGTEATTEAVKALERYGLDLRDHRATKLTEEVANWAEVLLVMEQLHLDLLAQRLPAALAKAQLFTECAGDAGDIEDPYGEPQEVYDACAARLADLVPGVVARLLREA
jgi:protein-tyrosine-phosphatase